MDRLTLAEYDVLVHAERLKAVDRDYRAHWQAFLNYQVQAEKKTGGKTRPVYTTFSKFFDYEKAIRAVEDPKAPKESGHLEGVGALLKKGGL